MAKWQGYGSGSLLVILLACYLCIDRSFYRNKSTFVEGCDQTYGYAASVGVAEWIRRDRNRDDRYGTHHYSGFNPDVPLLSSLCNTSFAGT